MIYNNRSYIWATSEYEYRSNCHQLMMIIDINVVYVEPMMMMMIPKIEKIIIQLEFPTYEKGVYRAYMQRGAARLTAWLLRIGMKWNSVVA